MKVCHLQSMAEIPITATGYTAIAIALGQYHTCVIVSGGTLKCWGYNGNGQLGIYNYNSQYSPVDVLGSGATIVTYKLDWEQWEDPTPVSFTRDIRRGFNLLFVLACSVQSFLSA